MEKEIERRKEIVSYGLDLVHFWIENPNLTIHEVIKVYEERLLTNNPN